MTAATFDRNTPILPDGYEVSIPIAANTQIFGGTLVCWDAAGRAVPASDTAGLKPAGRAQAGIDNRTGSTLGGAAGAANVVVWRGPMKLATSGGSAIVLADGGVQAFVLDDQTVVKTGGTTNTIKAGKVVKFESDGVWIDPREIV